MNNKIQKIKQKTMNYLKQKSKNIIICVGVLVIVAFTTIGKADEAKLLNLESKMINQSEKIADHHSEIRVLESENCATIQETAKLKLSLSFAGERELQDGENESDLLEKSRGECGRVNNKDSIGTTIPVAPIDLTDIKPKDLFYTFLFTEGAYTRQSGKEHFNNNGYMAIDVSTRGRKLTAFAPSLLKDGGDHSREYTVKLADNIGTMGETIELHWDEEGVKYAWSIGHMNRRDVKDGDVVNTGDPIGLSGGCPGELKLNEVSTGCHVHIELRIDGQAVEYPFDNNSKHKETGNQGLV